MKKEISDYNWIIKHLADIITICGKIEKIESEKIQKASEKQKVPDISVKSWTKNIEAISYYLISDLRNKN